MKKSNYLKRAHRTDQERLRHMVQRRLEIWARHHDFKGVLRHRKEYMVSASMIAEDACRKRLPISGELADILAKGAIKGLRISVHTFVLRCSKVLLREQTTREEEDLTLVKPSEVDESNGKFDFSCPPGESFLGKYMHEIVSAEIHGKRGRWEIIDIV